MAIPVKATLARLAYTARRLAPGAKKLLPKPVLRSILLNIADVNRAYDNLPQFASRRFLEDDVLPWLRDTCPRILFVGVGPYTYHYERLFRRNRKQFTTLDSDPSVAVWGASQHIVAPIQRIAEHRPTGAFDCVVMNGVFGFGVNEPQDMRDTARAAHGALRPGGQMILGWNHDLHRDPVAQGVLDPWFDLNPATPWGSRQTFHDETHVNDFHIRRDV